MSKELVRSRFSGKDFSKWKYNHYKTKWRGGIRIDELRKDKSEYQYIRFTNINNICLVTGDYGNWIFCREFWPSNNKDSGVSEGYWLEKLSIHSEQDGRDFSPELTKKAILEYKESFDGTWTEEDEEYFEDLLSNVDDEIEYTYVAYRLKPSKWDYEDVPFCRDTKPQLKVVFDAFEEMCNRITLKELKKQKT